MNNLTCEQVRDMLPDRHHGQLESPLRLALESHLRQCRECREEAEFVDRLWRARPGAPPGLEEAVLRRLREEAAPGRGRGVQGWRVGLGLPKVKGASRWFGVPSWALSAAALIVVAVGTGVLWNRWSENGLSARGTEVLEIDPVAPEAWLWDSGVVAGGPVLDGLTEEELETLLRELGG